MSLGPFDPLNFLSCNLRLEVWLDEKEKIRLDGYYTLTLERRRQADYVLANYRPLLLMQLDAPSKGMRPSVRKLLAQGKVLVKDGRYVIG